MRRRRRRKRGRIGRDARTQRDPRVTIVRRGNGTTIKVKITRSRNGNVTVETFEL
jgi:hypothetical protein